MVYLQRCLQSKNTYCSIKNVPSCSHLRLGVDSKQQDRELLQSQEKIETAHVLTQRAVLSPLDVRRRCYHPAQPRGVPMPVFIASVSLIYCILNLLNLIPHWTFPQITNIIIQ